MATPHEPLNVTNDRSVNLNHMMERMGDRVSSTPLEAKFMVKTKKQINKDYLSSLAKSKFDKIEPQPQEEAKMGNRIFDVVGRYRFYKGNGKVGFGESLDMGSLDASDEERIDKVKYTIT